MIQYLLSIPKPHTHLVGVEIRIPFTASPVELVMPSWTPGSYLLREFPRNVQDFEAQDAAGMALPWRKKDKNRWLIEADAVAGPVVVRYRVYANELSVRTSHLDATHAHINGASVFMFVGGAEGERAEVRIEAPSGWRAATALGETEDEGRLVAMDYDELVDSPIEIGTHVTLAWEQEGKPHRYVLWSAPDFDSEQLIADTRQIIGVCSAMFGGLPYEQFLFLVQVVAGGRGGLEHKASTTLQVPPEWFSGGEYESLLALVAHEFFHVWLAKRIRPEPLGPFDYTRENYTRNLWVVEGFTTYYTDRILLRAGVMTARRYLERLGDSIARLEALPGRHHQSLEDSSFDAWIKFYRPDSHTPNSQISYYHKGSLVALVLDLEIRRATGGVRSLDDVMWVLWERYGSRDVAFPEGRDEGIGAVVEEVGGPGVRELLDRYVTGTGEIDWDGHLEAVGMRLGGGVRSVLSEGAEDVEAGGSPVDPAGEGSPRRPRVPPTAIAPPAAHETRLGIRLHDAGGKVRVTNVLEGGPGEAAGLNAGDDIIAIDRIKATAFEVGRRLNAAMGGGTLELLVMRRDRLMQMSCAVAPATERLARIVELEGAAAMQIELREEWLRAEPWSHPR